MQARLKQGEPIMSDFTPGANVAAGDVVVVGLLPCVAHRPIGSGELGALAMGGAFYEVTADGALAQGVKVYWNNTAKKVTATASGNTQFGFVRPGSSSNADGDKIEVFHRPGV